MYNPYAMAYLDPRVFIWTSGIHLTPPFQVCYKFVSFLITVVAS